MVSMLRKRTCILVSMSIPCHICKGKGLSAAGGPMPRSLRPPAALLLGTRAEMPPTLRKSSKVMPSYTWSGPCAQQERKRGGCPQGSQDTVSPRVGPLGLWDTSPMGAQHCAPRPAQNWFPEPPWLQGAAFFTSTKAPSTEDGALWGAACLSCLALTVEKQPPKNPCEQSDL